uniref:Bromo domain-containing protein n=2 Tax=Odontella aurita TaxID=265563 RepID=A0A7S4JAQ4_9STRA|mmetsp:Transcript_42680/g.129645  ORF Transcript_42680/g.129645 Transcript_42680/m.129645 type:complete len:162 (+) Transcript_42680:701-1186(+)
MDTAALAREREELDGVGFSATRDHSTKRGPWALPKALEKKFTEIAKETIIKMNKHDGYQLFFEEVTEDEAPDYNDVVKNPMDFGTMKSKVERGEYGEGSDAAAALYEDFLLVFDNCALYNEVDGEVTVEAARLLGLLPETFSTACVTVATGKKKKSKKRRR